VKNSVLLAALAAVVFSTVLAQAPVGAQTSGQPAARAAAPIVLLDINAVFKGYRKMQDEMNRMKADVVRAEQYVKTERENIRKLAQRLEEFRKGTPDFKAIEEEVAKRSSDLSVKVQMQKKEFLEKEAQIFLQIYQEVQQEVAYYASATGVSMVLRATGSQADLQNPQEVLAYINRDVVWNAQQLDITNYILQRLNDRYGPSQTGSSNEAASNTRPGVGVYPNGTANRPSTQPASGYNR